MDQHFGKSYHSSSLTRVLRRMGFSRQKAWPVHPRSDPQAQRREIDAVLVTELSRWGRSMVDLLHTLEKLQAWRVVSVIALTGIAFGREGEALLPDRRERLDLSKNTVLEIMKRHRHANPPRQSSELGSCSASGKACLRYAPPSPGRIWL